MLSHRQGGAGRKSFLDDEDLTLLGWEVESGRFGTAKDVRNYIETQCGETYSMPGGYSLLKRLNNP